jgi:hypothetical protein
VSSTTSASQRHRIRGLFDQFGATDVAERAAALEHSDDATAASMAAVTRIANRVKSVTADARAAQ